MRKRLELKLCNVLRCCRAGCKLKYILTSHINREICCFATSVGHISVSSITDKPKAADV